MALDNFRSQKIIWDRANKKIFEKIEANSGDSNGRKLAVQIINQEATENLSGATLSLGWKARNGAKGLDAFDVIDATKGIFEIYYTTEMLSNIGDIEASLILINSTSRIESSTFTISVRPSTVDDESVESENSFTALTEALVKVNDFDEQLAQTAKKMNWVSIDEFPRIEGEQYDTERLQRAMDFAYQNEIQEVRLNAELYQIHLKHGGSTAASIIVPSDIKIIGQGIDKTIIKLAEAGGWCRMFHLYDVKNVEFEGITFDGNRYNVNDHEQMHILYINGGEYISVKKCKFFEARGDGAIVRKGTQNPFSFNVSFEDCIFESCGRNGFTFGSGFKNILLRGCVFQGDTYTQHIDSEPDSSNETEGIKIENCYCDGTEGGGMLTLTLRGDEDERDPSHVINSTFINTELYFNGAKNVLFSNNRITIDEDRTLYSNPISFRGDVYNVKFERNTVEVFSVSDYLIDITKIQSLDNHPRMITINDNVLITTINIPINISSSENIIISNNTLTNIDGTGTRAFLIRNREPGYLMENIEIKNNKVSGFLQAINLEALPDRTITNFFIKNNVFNNIKDYGFYTPNNHMDNVVNFVFDGNSFLNSTAQPIRWDALGMYYKSSGNSGLPSIIYCRDSPEGFITAPQGSIAIRTRLATAGSVFFFKETGSGNTGWVAK